MGKTKETVYYTAEGKNIGNPIRINVTSLKGITKTRFVRKYSGKIDVDRHWPEIEKLLKGG